MAVGVCVLAALTVLFCFTEIQISGNMCMVIWLGCIISMVDITGKRKEDRKEIHGKNV